MTERTKSYLFIVAIAMATLGSVFVFTLHARGLL